ncbi:unnamed protein product [Lathyrus oleraceus]|uniref:Uncharacterized protein n=2 Tax=Pisum sativum TaxID=3888 RepID=A0A9D4W885_PEA|nr:uncharacterized protein LOC127096819 isoform X2 [Pisum sativum]KAI5397948.1 hypothetical protein KIW84_063674 [Pisum sativum]
MKPKTGLELMLMKYSSECHETNLRNESSAGANADSKANTRVSAMDPLSEIVWSPDKGFSLKCVDSSFKSKNTSFLRGVEPSSMVLALLQSVTCGNSINDKPTDDVFVQPLAGICAESDVSSTNIPIRPPASDSVVIIPECKPYEHHDTDHIDGRPQENESKPSLEQNPSARKHCTEGGMYTCVDNKVVELEDGSYTRVEHVIEEKRSGALGRYIISSYNGEAATSAASSRVLVSKSVRNKNKSKINEMMLPYNKNGIHLTCENYHSKELFLASRKRCKQEVIIESKKVKMQIQETSPYSKSHVERDSSFMNLISNMMKGYSQQSSQDDVKSSALAQIRPINFVNSHGHRKDNTPNNSKVEETKEQFGDNQLLIETKKLPNCCINKESSSIGLKDEKGNSDHISKHNADHVTPFSRLRDSEPMVSMFAKRLGAIKQCQQTE